MDKLNSLIPEIVHVVRDKGTEKPFTGKYQVPYAKGTYLCRRCGLALFRADNQFTSSCGWPSFDGELANTVLCVPDRDGVRTEIMCQRCHAHLGHIFEGEGLTSKNVRHCVNSLAIEFVEDNDVIDAGEAILAAGCFWGVQYYLERLDGVLKTEVGYSGGALDHPTYQQVCSKTTGHLEAIRVLYDKHKLTYEEVLKYFFEIHDPTQIDGQGPDRGPQYLSAIFYFDDMQKKIAQQVIDLLKSENFDVATSLLPVSTFWPAEEYHQDYYAKNKQAPYCHTWIKR
ncbi:MAG: bifunctional methionine sulfoxide reductase B/A protein, partial [Gammaproteobacteria bacterium]